MSIISIIILVLAFFEMMVAVKMRPLHIDSCDRKGFKLIDAKFGNETYMLCLKLKPIDSSPIANQQSALLLNPDIVEEPTDYDDVHVRAIVHLSEFTMAYGFPLEDPSAGSAEGYIGDDHNFYGVLHLGNRTLHADPYGKDNPNRIFGSFENDMAPPRMRRHYSQVDFDRQRLPFHIDEHSRAGTARARICDLLLLADKQFFEKDANSSLNHTVRRMMHAVAQADIIFRNADFNEDGVPDNIGFTVKYIMVLTSEKTNNRVFGNIATKHAIDGQEYLMKFARLRRLSEVCLGVAFTGHAFFNRTLGLSFTSLGGGLGRAAGGLCDRRAYGRSFNTLAIAHATTDDTERVPERIAALTLAHEMGHSFGAHHDDNFPNPECRGRLMGSQSTSPDMGSSNMQFSLCSKRLIAATLSSMSYCLTNENRPFCGNGIVEEGEACDCGLPSLCYIRDPCCTPRAGGALIFEDGTLHKDGCSVAPSAQCHPSQGLCCLPNCHFADLSNNGISCENQDMDCKCSLNDTRSCRCGLGGRCLDDATCHAAECALLGLRECQCTKSPSGVLGDARTCGICCLLPDDKNTSNCIGVEDAAYQLMGRGIPLPDDWPGDDYNGPNVTLRLCYEGRCRVVVLRAWSVGTPCVSLGAVGMCSPRGLCSHVLHTPRTNVYPDIKRLGLKEKVQSSARRTYTYYNYSVLLSVLYLISRIN